MNPIARKSEQENPLDLLAHLSRLSRNRVRKAAPPTPESLEALSEFGSRSGPLTVGVEIEFFLLSESRLASDEQALGFLSALAQQPGWTSESETSTLFKMDDNRVTRTHFEYRPHLLEISTTYFDSIACLASHVQTVMRDIAHCAALLKLEIADEPTAARQEWERLPPDPDRRKIDESRLNEMRDAYGFEPREICQFPAYTASIHVHVGGVDWKARPDLISAIYAIESRLFLDFALGKPEQQARSKMEVRLQQYEACFPGFALVGIPDLPDWNLPLWLAWLERFDGNRDFQWVRPRRSGTLEFRSEPASIRPEAILAAAARRLGAVACALAGGEYSALPTSRARMLNRLSNPDSTPCDTERARQRIQRALKARGLGEERYLP